MKKHIKVFCEFVRDFGQTKWKFSSFFDGWGGGECLKVFLRKLVERLQIIRSNYDPSTNNAQNGPFFVFFLL